MLGQPGNWQWPSRRRRALFRARFGKRWRRPTSRNPAFGVLGDRYHGRVTRDSPSRFDSQSRTVLHPALRHVLPVLIGATGEAGRFDHDGDQVAAIGAILRIASRPRRNQFDQSVGPGRPVAVACPIGLRLGYPLFGRVRLYGAHQRSPGLGGQLEAAHQVALVIPGIANVTTAMTSLGGLDRRSPGPAEGPRDVLQLCRGRDLGQLDQSGLGLGGGGSDYGPHLGVGEPAFSEAVAHQVEIAEGPGDSDVLPGRYRAHAALPRQPVRHVPALPALPSPPPVVLTNGDQELARNRRHSGCQRAHLRLQAFVAGIGYLDVFHVTSVSNIRSKDPGMGGAGFALAVWSTAHPTARDPSASGRMAVAKGRLASCMTPASHLASAAEACWRRIRRDRMGVMARRDSRPVDGSMEAK